MASCHVCGAAGTRPYQTGDCCPLHTPAAVAGRPEVIVDPDLTLVALQRKAHRVTSFSRADTALNDARAVASGRRRAKLGDYRIAQKAVRG